MARKLLCSIFLFSILSWQSYGAPIGTSPPHSTLSKREAFEVLQRGGYKWSLTKTLEPEAEAKLQESQSEMRPRFQLGFRQYAARINPIQFGGVNSESIDTVGFGTSALEMKWSIIDSISQIKAVEAEANYKMSSAQAKHYQSELTALMLIQYLNVQRLQKQIELMDANIAKSKLILKVIEIKKNIGAGIPLEIARAKNLLQLDNLKKVTTVIKHKKAKSELATTLGVEAIPDLQPLEAQMIRINSPQAVVEKTQSTRNDLKAAQFALEAARKAQDKSGGLILPKLDLISEIGSTQPTLLGMPAKNANGFVGIALSIPLETGGLIEGKRKEIAILNQKADLQVRELSAVVKAQIKEAIEQFSASEEALSASADYLKTAEEESSLAQKKYAGGSSSILDLTSAHTNFAAANDMRVEQIFNYEAAKVNLYRAIGDFSDYFPPERK